MSEELQKLTRRQVRYKLFRIRDKNPMDQITETLFGYINAQLTEKNLSWSAFTHHWDISNIDYLKVISPLEWTAEGGKIDSKGYCEPAAFTKQD